MDKPCLHSVYFTNGKECDREYVCDGCETQKAIKRQVEIIMSEKKDKTEGQKLVEFCDRMMGCDPDLKPGQPCDHPGCLSHQSHPCEGCGRIGGR